MAQSVALGLPGAGQPLGVECQSDGSQAPACHVLSEDAPDDIGLGRVNDPSDPDAPPVPVPIHRLLVHGLAPIAEGDSAGAEAVQGLAFEASMGLPAQLPDVLRVHRPVDREKELGVVSTGVKTLVDEEQIDAVEAQFPEMLDSIHDIAAQTGSVVDKDQIKWPGLRERVLDQTLQATTSLDADAAYSLVRIDVAVEHDPVDMSSRFLAAVTELIGDRLRTLLIAAVARVDSAPDRHHSDSGKTRSSTIRSASISSHRSSDADGSPFTVVRPRWTDRATDGVERITASFRGSAPVH